MLYFAYGSNMALARIRARIPSAEFVTVATLPGHRLTFCKPGRDQSGKCDALFTGNSEDCVIGVVYRIAPEEKPILDRFEGLGVDYHEKTALLTTPAGDAINTYLYVATAMEAGLQPYHWYKHHVQTGAEEAGLPDAYLAQIRGIESIADPDPERDALERSIYRGSVESPRPAPSGAPRLPEKE